MPDGDIPFGMSFSIRRFYMICKRVEIDTIPACVWGMASSRVIVAVHGNMASKTDMATAHLAEFAVQAGWQVLSFDLPEHGDRKGRELPCTMPQCVEDTRKIWAYAHEHWQTVGLFGVSMGAYIALAATANEPPAFAWLLSPTVAMGRMIEGMMRRDGITPEALKKAGRIQTAVGQVYWWADYTFVALHPAKTTCKTAILYGAKDDLTGLSDIQAFVKENDCELTVSGVSAHWFHTNDDLAVFDAWLKNQTARVAG